MNAFAGRRGRLTTAQGEIPASADYKPSTDPEVSCATCDFFQAGHCSKWDHDVSPSYWCNEWMKLRADHRARVSATAHNRVIRAASKRVDDLEPKLADVLEPILLQAGEVAARNFAARAHQHLPASGFVQTFADDSDDEAEADGLPTMIAVYPRPDEAAAMAETDFGGGAADPQTMHVTLAYLGKTSGPLDYVADAVAAAAGKHAPLEGVVGGVGNFADNGKGHPAIALPSVPGLTELRQDVAAALTSRGIDYSRGYGYVPHLTIAYRHDGPTPPDIGLAGQPLHFDDLWVVRGDTEKAQMPLVGSKPLTAAADATADPGHEGEIPASAHYGPASDRARSCATCSYYGAGTNDWCGMWGKPVNPSYSCVDWAEGLRDPDDVTLDAIRAAGEPGSTMWAGPVRPVIAVDLDGTLNTNSSGYTGATVQSPPIDGAADWLAEMAQTFQIVIFTARAGEPEGVEGVREWLNGNGFAQVPCTITDTKPPVAIKYVDDLGWRFEGPGTYPTAEELLDTQPWWRTGKAATASGLPPIKGSSPGALADSLYTRASKDQWAVTDAVRRNAEAEGGEMSGLDDRLKSPSALAGKIENVAQEKGLTDLAAAEDVKDALRYTVVLPEPDYTAATGRILDRLLAATGMSLQRFRNYWLDDPGSRYAPGTYLGVNVVLECLDGMPVEVQFHTPESLGAQYENRELYRRIRKNDVPPDERTEIENQMRANNAIVDQPDGLDTLAAALNHWSFGRRDVHVPDYERDYWKYYRPLTADGAGGDEGPTIEEQLAAVAEAHRPDGGYGQTYWRQSDGSVFWISADWSTDDEVDAAVDAFMSIDGVEDVEACDECGDPGGDWVKVWPLPKEGITAAAAGDSFCLPTELRGKTDPVRLAFVKTVMTPALAEAGLTFDVQNPLVGKVIAQAGSHIRSISQTTQLDVMKVIRASYDEGLSITDTAQAIRAYMKEASRTRATMIARTELAGAQNGASLAATQIVAGATGSDYQKSWMTAPGAMYPRHENYEGLDGQTVDLQGLFQVGDDQLQFPGDPDGDPGEVINCRCAMQYGSPSGEEEATADEPPTEDRKSVV